MLSRLRTKIKGVGKRMKIVYMGFWQKHIILYNSTYFHKTSQGQGLQGL